MFANQIPQNFTYTSKTTTQGTGPRLGKDSGNEWVPGPGAYDQRQQMEKRSELVTGEDGKVQEFPKWDQRGYR